MNKIIVVSHPLIDHSLSVIHRKDTGTEEFRRHAETLFLLTDCYGIE